MTASKGGGQLGRCVTESTRRYASTKMMANALTTSGNTVYQRPAVPAPRLMAQKLLRRTASPAGGLDCTTARGRRSTKMAPLPRVRPPGLIWVTRSPMHASTGECLSYRNELRPISGGSTPAGGVLTRSGSRPFGRNVSRVLFPPARSYERSTGTCKRLKAVVRASPRLAEGANGWCDYLRDRPDEVFLRHAGELCS